jgi:hypothetical protein
MNFEPDFAAARKKRRNYINMKVTMGKTRWKIWLPLALLVIICAGGFYLLHSFGYISHIRVSKTKDGWVCSGPIQYNLMHPRNRPIVSDKCLIILEKYERRYYIKGFKIDECPMCFLHDVYYVTALSLSNGHTVYRTKIGINGRPLQVRGIWPWRENVIVWGYYQEEAGLFNHISSITILNARGKILKQFPITIPVKPMAADEKNNLLLCKQRVDEKDFEQFLDPQILHVLELPSGTEKLQVKISPFTDLAADQDGNVYIHFLNQRNDAWMDYAEKRASFLSACIEKYSVVPWQKIWSVNVTPQKGYSELLKYEKNMLWYTVYDRDGGPLVEDRRKWIGGPLNCKTGEALESQRKCDPYRIEAEVDGKHFLITRIDDKVQVTLSSQ